MIIFYVRKTAVTQQKSFLKSGKNLVEIEIENVFVLDYHPKKTWFHLKFLTSSQVFLKPETSSA